MPLRVTVGKNAPQATPMSALAAAMRRSAAASFGLHFEPLAEARFDLVFPATLASDGRVQALLDCLSNTRFRRDLGGMTGYRTARTGEAFTGAPA